jgi:hypothetical protein
MKQLLALVILLIGFKAQALEFGCQLKPSEINDVGTRMVKAYSDKGQSVPDSLVIASEFEAEVSSDPASNKYAMGTLEGFYRPVDDDFYSLIPIPVLGVALSRDRNMVYLCAHFDKDPAKTHITVYMLRGFKLDPTTLSTVVGNAANGPSLKIRPLTAALVDITRIRKEFLSFLKWIPLLDVGLEATNGIQRILSNLLGDFTGVGVERLTMTTEGVEIATGVILQNPGKAVITKFIPFEKKKK